MSTLKVEVVNIDRLEAHPNADRLELAVVKGWMCVVPKDVYKPGDKCIYFPIDSVLPQDVEEKIFPPDSKVKLEKSRVRTIKLRGAISQGLVVNPKLFGMENLPIGTDITKKLGVTKFEPPVNIGPSSNCNQASYKQTNPKFRKYTSIENFKNYNTLFEDGEEVVITEKIHGTNFRAGYLPTVANNFFKKVLKFFNLLPKYEFVYGSHNVQLQGRLGYKGYYPQNVYAEAVKNYDLVNKLKPGEVIYGEVYGDGVQKNYLYGCNPNQRKFIAFDIMVDDRYLNHDEFVKVCEERNIPYVPVLYTGNFDLDVAKKLATGDSTLESSQKVTEGVIIKPIKESVTFMGRKILKLINDEYLLNKNNTDFH